MFCIIFLLHPAATANPKESKDAVGNSATKTRKRSVLSTQICFFNIMSNNNLISNMSNF